MKPGEKLEIVLYAIMHPIEFLSCKKLTLVSQSRSNTGPRVVLVMSWSIWRDQGVVVLHEFVRVCVVTEQSIVWGRELCLRKNN